MLAGESLAQFEILQELAPGEFGPVYKARDSAANRDVEIEILPAAQNTVDRDRLRQEVKAASALDHWSIAGIYELARAGDTDFLVREHAPGARLAGPLPIDGALECARQIAGALAAGHSIGVTHRHLNPGNIVLTAGNAVKLVNFGLTPVRREDRYLAPEQLDGRGADARSDIYAFGQVLREISGPAAPPPVERIVARATQKNASRRYQLMEEIQQDLDRIAQAPAADHPPDPRRRMLLWVGAGVLAIVAIAWWMLGGRAAVNRGPARLTADSGLTTEAAISPDGKLLAYASDRGSPGVLHIWTQPVSGGVPLQLTTGADDDAQPALSPDAKRIVFRSERDQGGLYLVPAGGGAPLLLVAGGRDPRYSPDGRWIAYWIGDSLSPIAAGIWVIASSGGAPQRIHPEFTDARFPIFAPDGRHLLFVGRESGSEEGRGGRRRNNNNADWFAVPFDNGASGGPVIRTGAESLLHMQGLRESAENYSSGAYAIPEAWVGGEVLLSGRIAPMGPRDAGPMHLLRIPIHPTILEATGAAHEITTGAEWDAHPSPAQNGRLVFSRREVKSEIWSVAPDGSGDLHSIATDGIDVRPAISQDGKRLAYRTEAAGKDEIRVIEVDTGRQVARVAEEAIDPNSPLLLSPTGDEIVFSGRHGIMRQKLPGGAPQFLRIRGPWNRLTSWSADGTRILTQNWRGLSILNPENGEVREFLRSERDPVVEARFSPDARWVAFTLARAHSQVFLAPIGDAAESAWIAVTDAEGSAGSPAWSADGKMIYFLNQCQGFRCIWARKLDARKQPVGDAYPIRHFHHARWSLIPAAEPQNVGLVATPDQLIFGAFETTGNVWSLPSIPRP